MVRVRNVVVRSGTAILRTVTFRIPIANAVSTMIEYDWYQLPDESRKLIERNKRRQPFFGHRSDMRAFSLIPKEFYLTDEYHFAIGAFQPVSLSH
jgi:hypothetical protein